MKRVPLQRHKPLISKTELRRGGELARTSAPLRRTPVNPVSAKRRSENRRYSVLRREFLAAHPVCQLCGLRPATEVHHKAGRVGALLLDTSHWAALDHDCHAWATVNPQAAYACGISERRVA